MKCCRAALLACAFSSVSALHVSPLKSAPVTVSSNATQNGSDVSDVLAGALEAAQAMIGAHSRPHTTHAAASNTSATNGTRAKIDLGFTEFEAKMEEQLKLGCQSAFKGEASWTPELQQQLVQNVTGEFSAGLKKALAPIKSAIGKTWMALPEDEQKDGYVVTLRTDFAHTLDSNVDKMAKHLQLGFSKVKRLSEKNPKLSAEELLRQSEQTINDNLLTEHCYDATFTQRASAPKGMKKLSNFCIKSTVGSMIKRLNDTQGMVSMTMRFDSGAMMSLVQEPQVA